MRLYGDVLNDIYNCNHTCGQERCELLLVIVIVAARPARAFHVFGSTEFGTRSNFLLNDTKQYLSVPSLLIKNSLEKARQNGRKIGPATARAHAGANAVPTLRRESHQSVRWLPKYHVLLNRMPANRLAHSQGPLQKLQGIL